MVGSLSDACGEMALETGLLACSNPQRGLASEAAETVLLRLRSEA